MLLTTVDNKFSPFDQWEQWYAEDLRLGYDTCRLIARLATGYDETDEDSDLLVMFDIANDNISGKHIIVVREDYNPFLNDDLFERN